MAKKHLKPEEVLGTEKVFSYYKCNGKYYEQSVKDGKPTFIEVSKKKDKDEGIVNWMKATPLILGLIIAIIALIVIALKWPIKN